MKSDLFKHTILCLHHCYMHQHSPRPLNHISGKRDHPSVCESVSRSVQSLGKNTGVSCHSLLQGIFPTQALNPCLLHSRKILYHLSHQGNSICIIYLVFKVSFLFQNYYFFPIFLGKYVYVDTIFACRYMCWHNCSSIEMQRYYR